MSGTPEYSFELRYRGNIQEMWQAILEYVHKLPDLTILLRSESPLQLTYQSKHFRQIIVVNLSSAVQPGEANIVIHVFDDTSQPASGDQQVPATRLFAYAALKTQALDQNFRQTSGAGGPAEARWGGVWKMGGGAALLLLGLNLTAATNGKVLFYGAIVWGAILLLTGVVQTVMGRNVE